MTSGKAPLLLVVTGPTASGKTALAVKLAQHFNTEIVSADSRQIFRDIPVGTAAPTAAEQAGVLHHLVGILPLDAYYSAARFEQDALAILDKVWKHSDIAVVCGGSMLYVDALCKGIDDMPTVSPETRNHVLALYHNQGPDAVMALLRIYDPEYAAVVDAANTRRIIHALEICMEASRPYSSFRTGKAVRRPFRILKLMIDHPREALFERINTRVEQMFADGLLDEAKAALSKGDFNSLNTVGYKEIAAYLRGEMDFETAKARIAKNTRVYAKKQLTWLNKDSSVVRLNPATAFEDALAAIDAFQQS